MKKIAILWVDDEIDLLRAHILLLQEKDFEVTTVNNGSDALAIVKQKSFDIIFLDENMPGMNGLMVLEKIKEYNPAIPVVMVTKSEEEQIMDEAVGSKISDYLIKPVNPKQILLTIKKHCEQQRLITEKTTTAYQIDFGKIGIHINEATKTNQWIEIYKKLVYWELELEKSGESAMNEVLRTQKVEANNNFSRFIRQNYLSWFDGSSNDKPLLSQNVLKEKLFNTFRNKNVLLVIDNLRFDQWKILQPFLSPYFSVCSEDVYYSILPTATQYSRNALFAGLMPSEIQKLYPNLWLEEDDEGIKNQFEEELLSKNLSRHGINIKFTFHKIFNNFGGEKLLENLPNLLKNELTVIVFNFVDMLSHARNEMKMLKELAIDEAAYRSLTASWFEHSSLFEIIKTIANHNCNLIITTDHGTVQVTNPVKVIGEKETTDNLRYKHGKKLSYNSKEVFEIKNPAKAYLPAPNFTSSYIFAYNNDFFVYPNNYNHYVNIYKNTFMHGGISMQEMLIPIISLSVK